MPTFGISSHLSCGGAHPEVKGWLLLIQLLSPHCERGAVPVLAHAPGLLCDTTAGQCMASKELLGSASLREMNGSPFKSSFWRLHKCNWSDNL